ncbi:MAG: TolC family protein [Planctomycetota bacterium]
MRRLYGPTVLILIATIGSVGCNGGLDRLDQHAAELIQKRAELTLGQTPEPLDRLVPAADDIAPRDAAYRYAPTTNNPPAQDLPAATAPPETRNAYAQTQRDTESISEDQPGPPLELDLPAILAQAIATAPDYRAARESLLLTTLSLIVERNDWGPRFFDTLSATLAGDPEDGSFEQALTLVNEFGVTQRLPSGGSVSASALINYTNLLRENAVSGEREIQSAALRFGFNLPLLRDAGVIARESLIQAERNLIYEVRDFERFRRSFFVDIANTYFDLLRRQRELDNRRRQLESLQRLADRFNALAEAGREPLFEAERSEQQVLFEQSNLVNAVEDYESRLDSFKLTLGIPTTRDITILASDFEVPEPILNPVEAVETARLFRLDLQTRRDRIDDAARAIDNARNQLQADFDLSGSLTVPTDDDDNTPGFDLDVPDTNYSLGARISFPLDRLDETATLRRTLINYERVRRDTRVFSDRVALNVRSAIRNIRQARFDLDLQDRNIQLAERRVLGVRLRERTLGPRDVIEAQADLLEARLRRDTAVANLQQSVLDYLLETGQMRVASDGSWQAPARLQPIVPTGVETPEARPPE